GAAEEMLSDYRSSGLTLGAHPLALLRQRLQRERALDSRQLRGLPHGRGVHTIGLVTQRQRPGTANGTIFVTLEDEHGMVNVVVWSHLALRRRKHCWVRACSGCAGAGSAWTACGT